MSVSPRNGWGWISNLVTGAKSDGATNTVQSNTGVAAQIQAAGQIRLSKLCWRIDLAPDVAAGTVPAPTQYRVVVLGGTSQLPNDVSVWQASRYGSTSAHPEIPNTSPLEVLFDLWLDVGAGDPGLNQLATLDFADAGPTVPAGSTMIVLFVPMITSMTQTPLMPANSTSNIQLSLGVYGLGDNANLLGGNEGARQGKSIPRYDVNVGG